MQKWGKNKSGSQRFKCKFCESSETLKRTDLSKKYKNIAFQKWLLGKNSLAEIAQENDVTIRTLNNWFSHFWDKTIPKKKIHISDKVVLLDGKYLESDSCVLIATCDNKVADWNFVERESFLSWLSFLKSFESIPFAIVCDGQKGLLKSIKQSFSRVIIQRCQFHVVKFCTIKLTRSPKTFPAQKLRSLVLKISLIKDKDNLKIWIEEYINWYKDFKHFLNEKTYHPDSLTRTGKIKWSYTHKNVRASFSHLRNALPYLFNCLNHKEIPNTTNFLEGGINRQIQEKIRNHRGLNVRKKKVLVNHFLCSKQ